MQNRLRSSISIVVPAKNEGAGIGKILQLLKKYSNDIIVVDGHSQDNTETVTKKAGGRFYLDNGKGKGDAMKVGVLHAKHDAVIFFDADGSHDPKGIPEMAKLLLSKKADFVMGSRRTGGSFDISMSFTGIIRSAGCDFLVMLINKRFGTKLTDVLYSFRGVRKPVFTKLRLKENGFGIEQEMVMSCLKNGYKIKEIPSREYARGWGVSKLRTIEGFRFLSKVLSEYV